MERPPVLRVDSARDKQDLLSPLGSCSPRRGMVRKLFRSRVLEVVKERKRDMDTRANLAALYVADAFEGRLEHGLGKLTQKHPETVWAFVLQTGNKWLMVLVVCNALHTALTLLEPPQAPLTVPWRGGTENYCSASDTVDGSCAAAHVAASTRLSLMLRVAELFFCAIYAADAWLKVKYMGLRDYCSKPWQQLYLVVVAALALDAVSFGRFRLARAFRPAVSCLRVRSVRRFFTVVRDMAPGFVRVCVPLAFLILLSSSFAAMAFGRLIPELAGPGGAAYALWVLVASTDNYEDLLPREVWGNPWYLVFFFAVLLLGNVFLLSLLLGVTFDVFIEHTSAQVKSERLKELRGLTVAFTTLDPTGTGRIPLMLFDKFLGQLKPRLQPAERLVYHNLLTDFTGELDVIAWLDLRQVLDYKVVRDPLRNSSGTPHVVSFVGKAALGAATSLPAVFLRKVIAAAVVLDAVLLPYVLPRDAGAAAADDAAAGGFLATWWPNALCFVSLDTIAAAVTVVLLADLAVRAVSGGGGSGGAGSGRGSAGGLPPRRNSRGGSVPLANTICAWALSLRPHESVAFGALALHAPVAAAAALLPVAWAPVRAAYALRLLRCWRLVTLSEGLHENAATFCSISFVFLQSLSFAVIIAFFFGLAFSDTVGVTLGVPGFESPGPAMMTLIKLFFGVGLGSVVGDAMEAAGPAVVAFFVTYHIVGVLIVFNLINAIVMHFYSEALNERSRSSIEEQRKVDKELQESMLVYMQEERVLRLWGDKGRRTAKELREMSVVREARDITGRELRRVLGAGRQGPEVTEADLKKCQKHAKVDLVAALRRKEQRRKSVLEGKRARSESPPPRPTIVEALRNPKSPGANAAAGGTVVGSSSSGGAGGDSGADVSGSGRDAPKDSTPPQRRMSRRASLQGFGYNVDALQSEFRQGIDDMGEPRVFKDGDIVMRQGQTYGHCFMVRVGMVRVLNSDGEEETVDVGGLFGELAVLAHLPQPHSVVAIGRVVVAPVERSALVDMIASQSPTLRRRSVTDSIRRSVTIDGQSNNRCSPPASFQPTATTLAGFDGNPGDRSAADQEDKPEGGVANLLLPRGTEVEVDPLTGVVRLRVGRLALGTAIAAAAEPSVLETQAEVLTEDSQPPPGTPVTSDPQAKTAPALPRTTTSSPSPSSMAGPNGFF